MNTLNRDAYGNIVNDEMKNFHKSRTMFALIGEQVFHKENSEDSHVDWFIKEDWIKDINDPTFEAIIRGYFNPFGIFFYKGIGFYGLQDNDFVSFNICITYLKTLIQDNLPVYSGLNSCSESSAYIPKAILGRLYNLPQEKFKFGLTVNNIALL